MASMSYCLFRNTSGDFSQCLERVGNMGSINELSKDERDAARRMRDEAEQYVEWFDQLEVESLDDEEPEDDEE